jgi:hypothetical protein
MFARFSTALLMCGTLANAANVCHGVANAPHMLNHFPDDEIEKHPSVADHPISRSFRLSLKADGPEFLVTIRSVPLPDQPTHPVRTGEIIIARCEDGTGRQTLPVMGWQAIGVGNLRTFDINFDGYLDLSILMEVGSTYGSQLWWIYDPASGKFVQNHLTRELSNIRSNGYSIDTRKHEIAFSNLRADCPSLTTRCRIEPPGLLTVHEETAVQGVPCIVTFLDRVNGTMKVTAVRRFIDDKPVK